MAQLRREQANAIYLKQLYLVAKNKVSSSNLSEFPIDPQGRILIDIELSHEHWGNIQRSFIINPQEGAEAKNEAPENIAAFKKLFIEHLGHPITDITTFSYDMQTKVSESSPLEKKLKALNLDSEINFNVSDPPH